MGESAPRVRVQGSWKVLSRARLSLVSQLVAVLSSELKTDTCQSTCLSAAPPSSARAGLDNDSVVPNGSLLMSEHLQEGSSPQLQASRLGAEQEASFTFKNLNSPRWGSAVPRPLPPSGERLLWEMEGGGFCFGEGRTGVLSLLGTGSERVLLFCGPQEGVGARSF